MIPFYKSVIFCGALICAFSLTACKESTEMKPLLPKLLDLGSHKCIPCQMMTPILDELTEEYKGVFDVEFTDVWMPENKEQAIKHGVQTIPTQIFFDANGKELWRHEGFLSKEDILRKWEELGFNFKQNEERTQRMREGRGLHNE